MGIAQADESSTAITFAVIASVLKISLLIGVGVRLELKGFLDDKKRKCLSGLAMDVCLPCLMFSSVLPEADVRLLALGWELLLVPVLYVSVGGVIGMLCCLLVGTPPRHLGVAAACAAFPNVNGFPVSIVTALGTAIPKSPNGFSALVYLSLIQITDGLLKYTIGPAILKRDKRVMMEQRSKETTSAQPVRTESGGMPPLQLGQSMLSFDAESQHLDVDPVKAPEPSMKNVETVPDFGVSLEQVRSVTPEWSRQEAYALFSMTRSEQLLDFLPKQVLDEHRASTATAVPSRSTQPAQPQVQQPLLEPEPGAVVKKRSIGKRLADSGKFFREVCPPQVLAVVLALAIGAGPEWLRPLFLGTESNMPPLGFVYGTAKQLGGGAEELEARFFRAHWTRRRGRPSPPRAQLYSRIPQSLRLALVGGGFVPMQMISLGGRLVGIASAKGPLAPKGAAGPGGRAKLLKISCAVGCARMLVSPMALYSICLLLDRILVTGGSATGGRPLAWWVPGLIVGACPTANNMSTMADMVGAGRSISAASTALQLILSPIILTVTLSFLITQAQNNLASDFRDGSGLMLVARMSRMC